MQDTKQIAQMTLDTVKEHLKHCEEVKKKISALARNIKKGVSLDVREITGVVFLDILEVTSLAPAIYRQKLMEMRAKLEREVISPARHAPSIAAKVRGFLNVFYKAYSAHYAIVFGEQIKSLIAMQNLLSKSSIELARSGARDVQDQSIQQIEADIEKIEEENEEWELEQLEDGD